jgi:hypothetical protein
MAPPLAGRNGGGIQASIDTLDQVADYIQGQGERVLASRLDVVANTLGDMVNDEQAQSILAEVLSHTPDPVAESSGVTLDWIRGELDKGRDQHEVRREAMQKIKMDNPGVGMI